MALSWPAVKDPDEVKDYGVDWSPMLVEDSLATSTWIVGDDDTLTIDSQSNTDMTTTVWLSGGTEGITYQVLNRVTTAGGRTYDQTIKLKVKTK